MYFSRSWLKNVCFSGFNRWIYVTTRAYRIFIVPCVGMLMQIPIAYKAAFLSLRKLKRSFLSEAWRLSDC